MENNKLDVAKYIKHWVDNSDEDFETMNTMYITKQYSWSMFLGHIMIEKLLKALYIKVNLELPPHIHNLTRLAEKCNIEIDEEQRYFFVTVTAFNLNARYDDYKKTFRQTCTPEFCSIWIEKLKTHRLWIKRLIE
jgi:HEPN domain-containing protein